MPLPKLIPVQNLNQAQIDHITEVVFGSPNGSPHQADAIFVFGGTHPGAWERAAALYHQVRPRFVFVSGGSKEGSQKHASWTQGQAKEADVITDHLVRLGVPTEVIIQESQSQNSLENVVFLQDQIRSRNIRSLICVCKSYGVGRQGRTIRKHLPEVEITLVGFDTDPEEGALLTRENWHLSETGRARIWGEYVRNCLYARKGDIVADFMPPPDLLQRLRDLENPTPS